MDESILKITKVYEAPIDKVFRAWTEKEAVEAWYGPEGMTTKVHEMDAREGGSYSLTMKGEMGEHHLSGSFKEIKAPEKLVFTWAWKDSPEGETLVTVEFKDLGGKTEVTLIHELKSKESRDNHDKGWSSSFDKLESFLKS